jgi:regulator of RNase E activity RraA
MSDIWNNDEELFALAKHELFTAVVGDAMDRLGLTRQFLPPQVRPLDETSLLIGRAMPVVQADFDVYPSTDPLQELSMPFGLMLDALDDLMPNEVYVCGGASPNYALWGELMSVAAMNRGARGAVMAGYSRDTRAIRALGFPCFSFGPYAQDQAPRGRVVDFRCSLVIGGVEIEPGDLVIGDLDGVCIVPRSHEREVFTAALEKARAERVVFDQLRQGMGTRQAFAKYGVM